MGDEVERIRREVKYGHGDCRCDVPRCNCRACQHGRILLARIDELETGQIFEANEFGASLRSDFLALVKRLRAVARAAPREHDFDLDLALDALEPGDLNDGTPGEPGT